MKKIVFSFFFLAFAFFSANAQLGGLLKDKNIKAATKAVQAFTLTDADIAKYCQEYVDWSDANNPLCSVTDEDPGKKAFATRLEKIKESLPFTEVNGQKLDIQAYYVVDINAFACANGSIRVFAGLMEVMTDDEILGVIGHEIGHIANTDSKDAFKTALLTSALKDVASSTGKAAAALSDSQLGALGEALTNAQFSQKQEMAADKYGFEFLKKCNKPSSNMASSLGVLLKLQNEAGGNSDNKFQKLLSTHPDLDKRIQTLSNLK